MYAEMKTDASRNQAYVLIALSLSMVATRIEHFGGAVHLPDASLAVFALAGWAGAAVPAFLGLLALAAGIDLWAVTWGGVAADCFTPAYPALAIAYGLLFAYGRWGAARPLSWASAVGFIVALFLAFAVSNLSFFWLSGLFPDLALRDYVAATWHYAPSYVGYGFAYAVAGVTFFRLVNRGDPITAAVRHDA